MQSIELCDKQQCTGCSACFNICPKNAIVMDYDDEGFLYPKINHETCIRCGLCRKICPIIQVPTSKAMAQPIAVYAGYYSKLDVRKRSSSGGAFAAFANYYYSLENGQVVGASFDETLHLKHCISTKRCDISKFQGSKYLQSEIGLIFRDINRSLQQGVDIMFVGTPCQVAGLQNYLRKDYVNLLTIDLVCHGVPSPGLFQSYLKQIGVTEHKKYRDFYFRSRKNSAYFLHSVQSSCGVLKQVSPAKHSYICAYLQGWLHRESCYHCPFASIPRQGDVSIADFWGILTGKVPFNGDASNGVSMIMINTTKGQNVFDGIKESLYYEEKSLDDAKIDNHNLYTHDIRPEIRDTVYKEIKELSPVSFMRKYNLHTVQPSSFGTRVLSKIRGMFGL